MDPGSCKFGLQTWWVHVTCQKRGESGGPAQFDLTLSPEDVQDWVLEMDNTWNIAKRNLYEFIFHGKLPPAVV